MPAQSCHKRMNKPYRSEGYPYGIFGPWARWGWGLDGLKKLFRCRRHRRPLGGEIQKTTKTIQKI